MNSREKLPEVAPVEVEALLADITAKVDERMAEIRALNKYVMRLETSVMLACSYLRQPVVDLPGALHALDYALRMKDHEPHPRG
jgi:hypothetical protein